MPRRKKKVTHPELSGLELEIMNIVWDLGECSSAEVIAAVGKKRRLADTTVRTVLTNIRKKGYLELVPTVERGYRLRPTIDRAANARRSLKRVVARLFEGSPQEAITYLIEDENLTDEDLDEIRRAIRRRKG